MHPILRRLAALLGCLALVLTSTSCGAQLPMRGSTIRITAYLSDSSGLFVGNDVGILGVPVGRVTKITPEGTRVRVEMQVKADQPIPAKAGAVVVARSVATDRYVELTPVYHSGPRMKDHAVIPLDQTRTPVSFDEVLENLAQLSDGLAGSQDTKDAVKRFVATADASLNGNGPALNKALKGLASSTDTVSEQRQNFDATMDSLDQLTTTFAANQRTVDTFIKQVAAAAQLLATERGEFIAALRSTSQMVRAVAQFARENRTEIEATLRDATKVADDVAASGPQVAEILGTMPLALQNVQRAERNRRLVVRMPPEKLAPLSDELSRLCQALPLDLCSRFGTDPLGILDALSKLLGGKP